jgi:hypothetical protein
MFQTAENVLCSISIDSCGPYDNVPMIILYVYIVCLYCMFILYVYIVCLYCMFILYVYIVCLYTIMQCDQTKTDVAICSTLSKGDECVEAFSPKA